MNLIFAVVLEPNPEESKVLFRLLFRMHLRCVGGAKAASRGIESAVYILMYTEIEMFGVPTLPQEE